MVGMSFSSTTRGHIAWLFSDVFSVIFLLAKFEIFFRAVPGYLSQFVTTTRYALKREPERLLKQNFDMSIFTRDTITRTGPVPWGYTTTAFMTGILDPQGLLPAIAASSCVTGTGAILNALMTRILQIMQKGYYKRIVKRPVSKENRRSFLSFIALSINDLNDLHVAPSSYDKYMGNVLIAGRIIAGQFGLQIARPLAALILRLLSGVFNNNPSLNEQRFITDTVLAIRTATFLCFVNYASLLVYPFGLICNAFFQFFRYMSTMGIDGWRNLGESLRQENNRFRS